MKLFLSILCSILLLNSCSLGSNVSTSLENKKDGITQPENAQITLEDVLQAENLIAIRNEQDLYLIDPEFPKPYALYKFNTNEAPVSNSLDSLLVSPQKNWIAWYSPLKGIVALNIRTLQTKVVHTSDSFLSTYPYIEFLPKSDTLLCITNNGNAFLRTELNSFTQTSISIPYPYGNVFKVSPDQQKLAFVSGFGQSKTPKFLITSVNGSLITQFEPDINMTDRHMVYWSTDSSGLFLIKNNTLIFHPLSDSQNPDTFFEFSQEISILSFAISDSQMYVSTSDGYWHIIDIFTRKEIARAPFDIASELQTPKFYPWHDKQFLIEETVSDSDGQYNRLWLSDIRGVKKLLMNKYNQAIVKTLPTTVD